MAAMALEVGFREVIVEKSVALQPRGLQLHGVKVQGSFQGGEGFLLPEDSCGHEIADVREKVFGLLKKSGFRPCDLPLVEAHGGLGRKAGVKISKRFPRIFGEFKNRGGERAARDEGRTEHNIENGEGEKVVGFPREIRDALADGRVDDGLPAKGVRDSRAVPFEQKLIDAIVFVKETERGLKTLGQSVESRRIEALVVHTLQFEHDTGFSRLREEDLRAD